MCVYIYIYISIQIQYVLHRISSISAKYSCRKRTAAFGQFFWSILLDVHAPKTLVTILGRTLRGTSRRRVSLGPDLRGVAPGPAHGVARVGLAWSKKENPVLFPTKWTPRLRLRNPKKTNHTPNNGGGKKKNVCWVDHPWGRSKGPDDANKQNPTPNASDREMRSRRTEHGFERIQRTQKWRLMSFPRPGWSHQESNRMVFSGDERTPTLFCLLVLSRTMINVHSLPT